VWHNNDAQIKPREEQQWNKVNKNRHYSAVFHLKSQKAVQLSNEKVSDLALNTNRNQSVLGYSNQAHLEKIMYGGFFADYYSININTGEQTPIIKNSPFTPSLAPNGRYAAYFAQSQVQLKDLKTNKVTALSKAINATFADDKHDYPSPQPGYGFAGWLNNSSQVLVYSKYDIWAFDVNTQRAERLTNGKPSNTQYRVIKLDKNHVGFAQNDTLLVSAINLQSKQREVAKLDLASQTVTNVLSGKKRIDVVKKAKHADKYLFTEQTIISFLITTKATLALQRLKKLPT